MHYISVNRLKLFLSNLKEYINNKTPTKLSQLENDSNYATTSDLDSTNTTLQETTAALDSFKSNFVSLTQSEYDALETKDADTYYCITDAPEYISRTEFESLQSKIEELLTQINGEE